MRILHFSDTHLGYQDLDKTASTGINLREQDFYDSFTSVIDAAIENPPDLIVHSGDFFHRPSPTNRAMTFALEQLKRLEAHKLPIVVIAGNHETPRTIYTSPILRAMKTIKGVYPIFGQAYETVEVDGIVVHGLPHINDVKTLFEEMDRIEPVADKFNILMLHTSIGKDYMMEEYGEQLYPKERLDLLDRFDYVALGHWHNFQQVKKLKTAWYCGSTERMSDTETGKEKGYCVLELEQGKIVQPAFIKINTRNWYRIDIKNCKDKTVTEIEADLKTQANQLDLKDCILSLYFHDIQGIQSVQLANRIISEWLPEPIYIHVKRKFDNQADIPVMAEQRMESMDELMGRFIDDQITDNKKAKQLTEKAKYYFDLFESGEYKNR